MRHGQSQANADRTIAGQLDSPLTELGIHQAQQVAKAIRQSGIKIEIIFSSPLLRALKTAQIIASENGIDVTRIIQVDELSERAAGSYTGQSVSSYMDASESEKIAAGAESLEALYQRVETANEKITPQLQYISLVVGHSGFYRMALCVNSGLSPDALTDQPRPANGILLDYPL